LFLKVYLDFGLAVPKLSVHGMVSSVKELLDLASIKKVKFILLALSLLLFMSNHKILLQVMFSTDGYASPETYYLG